MFLPPPESVNPKDFLLSQYIHDTLNVTHTITVIAFVTTFIVILNNHMLQGSTYCMIDWGCYCHYIHSCFRDMHPTSGTWTDADDSNTPWPNGARGKSWYDQKYTIYPI